MHDEKIKVFIADHHPLILEGLLSVIQRQVAMKVSGYATTGSECLLFFKDHVADVVLLDIFLPDINGMDLCGALLKEKPALNVLAFSMSKEGSHVRGMLAKGARGYLLKTDAVAEICTAIVQVSKGHIFISREASDSLYHNLEARPELPHITRREKEILTCIADGLTASEIAAKLFVSQLTIESHRRNLMTKLKARNTAVLIRIAVENQLI